MRKPRRQNQRQRYLMTQAEILPPGLWEVGSAHCDRPSWPGGAENCGWLQESALLTRCASYPGDVNSGDEVSPPNSARHIN